MTDYVAGIDNVPSLGLAGIQNSVGYRVAEIERHLHGGARWFELAASASLPEHAADRAGTGGGPFRIDAANDDWGTWLQILGSTDTPAITGQLYFDPHQVIIDDVERASMYVIQFARGASGAAALEAGTYTEFVYAAANTKDTAIIHVQTGRAPVGSLLWARCICPGADTGWMDFYFGVHGYEG